MEDKQTTIKELREYVDAFITERNWKRMHTPLNLATAITLEAAELLEHFQWSDPAMGDEIMKKKHQAIAFEAADVAITLIAFCNRTGLDLATIIQQKLTKHALKYPVVEGQDAMDDAQAYELMQGQKQAWKDKGNE
jgi:dCTP diphosphatase